MPIARKLISFDWAIKRVLRGKANFDTLEGFLSELLYFDFGDGDDYIYKGTTNFKGLHNNTTKDSLNEWTDFLKNETIPNHPKTKGLEKAKETLDYLAMPQDEQTRYDQYQTDLRDQASAYESTFVIGEIKRHKRGREERLEEGEKNKAYEIATNLPDLLDDKTISSKTGLSAEDVKKLREKNYLLSQKD